MKRPGRPLQFLGGVIGLWVAARAGVMLAPLFWPEDEPLRRPGMAVRDVETAVAASDRPIVPEVALQSRSIGLVWARPSASARAAFALLEMKEAQTATSAPKAATVADVVDGGERSAPAPQPPARQAVRPSTPSRWSGTAWLLWRPDGIGGLAQGPLLGGSQMGARIDYRLLGTAERGLNLYGRASRAVARPFAEEAAIGLALRPVRGLPVSLLAERRIRLGTGGRNGVALFAAGGIGPRPLARHVELEGYAQAGIVGLPGTDGFVDGRLSLDYRLVRPPHGPDLALGASLSGSAQPGATRLDLGPQLRLRLPAGRGHLRLSAEWRERVAGDARPARGPVFTLVTDF